MTPKHTKPTPPSLKATAGSTIEEGKYSGSVQGFSIRESRPKNANPEDDSYWYVDYDVLLNDVVDSEGVPIVQRVSYPYNLTPKSDLGQTFERFGVDWEVGKTYEPDEVETLFGNLLGRSISVVFVTDPKDDRYVTPVRRSFKPI